jgi:MFS transporter, OCT family, solute carrier family 22 (organic cation transporter), member 4/5
LEILFILGETAYIRILALSGKFFISLACACAYIITAESYPTVIRGTALSVCNVFDRFGALLAPYIQLLVSYFVLFILFVLCFFQ